jgi:hypothetical protein
MPRRNRNVRRPDNPFGPGWAAKMQTQMRGLWARQSPRPLAALRLKGANRGLSAPTVTDSDAFARLIFGRAGRLA